MIGKKYNNLKNDRKDFDNFLNQYSNEEIKRFFSSLSGGCLGNKNTGHNKPSSKGGIPDVRRVYGAGLKVLSSSFYSVSEQTKFYADIIVNKVMQEGFITYDKKDALIAYVCLKSQKLV